METTIRFAFRPEAATFLKRPNRFRVIVRREVDGSEVAAHCADPGRLRELLIPGARVHISPAASTSRKTSYDLRFVEHPDGELISLDTRLPNEIFDTAVRAGGLAPFIAYTDVEREVSLPRVGEDGIRSRIDFKLSNKASKICWVEVKSATLVVDGEARFPDAPTVRGRRHLAELTALSRQGARAAVVFVVQRPDARCLAPNWETDPVFGQALADAQRAGVELHAYTCQLTLRSVEIAQKIPVVLHGPNKTNMKICAE